MPVIRLENFQQFSAINVLSDPGAVGGKVHAPNCAQISLLGGVEGGKTWHIVLGGRYAGGFAGSVAQASSIHTALSTGGSWTALAAFLSTTFSFGAVRIRDVNTIDQPIIESTSTGVAGTSASPALPSEVAAVGTKRTGLTGPANRGRIYFSGWATNSLGAGNVIAAAAVTAYQNWLNLIATALSAQGYTHVIIQPDRAAYTGSTGTQHAARTATSVAVSSVAVRDNHWDSQRRRGLK